jgi:hypothetical protein
MRTEKHMDAENFRWLNALLTAGRSFDPGTLPFLRGPAGGPANARPHTPPTVRT